ncbi:hypothetical protein Scep_006729 [Stephania cephalantha]|uniref:Uncharacterized protein n=1 Tax=Stephania cephalantha TaxID=152367 RepID=A0AAP0K8P5_9MAGN
MSPSEMTQLPIHIKGFLLTHTLIILLLNRIFTTNPNPMKFEENHIDSTPWMHSSSLLVSISRFFLEFLSRYCL